MIIEELDESLFISRFEDHKRVTTPENPNGNFTYRGLRALFQYLDEISDEENPYKLDVIALCCEFSEYKDIEEFLRDYGNTLNDFEGAIKEGSEYTNEFKEYLEEEINNNTTLIKFDDDLDEGFIIASY